MLFIQDDKFLSKESKYFIKNKILSCDFPMYFNRKILDDSDDYNAFFCHQILKRNESKWNSNAHKFFENLVFEFTDKHKIKIKEFLRMAVNLTFCNGEVVAPIHQDHPFKHNQLLIYLNDVQDKDSKTILLKEDRKTIFKEITPKQYRGVLFENVPHFNYHPKFGERYVFVCTFR